MKKVLSSVVLAVFLIAALATVSLAVDVSGPGTVEPGETVTITVTGSGEATSGLVSVQGMTVQEASGGFSSTNDLLVLKSHGGLTATYTCRVTANPGERVSFSVSNVVVSNGSEDQPGTDGSWRAVVASNDEPVVSPDPTQKPNPTTAPEPTVEPDPTQEPNPTDDNRPVPTQEPSASSSQAVPTGDGSQVPASEAPSIDVNGTITDNPSSGPSQGGTTVVSKEKLPKTADSSVDLWTFLAIGAGLAVVVVVAGRKVYANM